MGVPGGWACVAYRASLPTLVLPGLGPAVGDACSCLGYLRGVGARALEAIPAWGEQPRGAAPGAAAGCRYLAFQSRMGWRMRGALLTTEWPSLDYGAASVQLDSGCMAVTARPGLQAVSIRFDANNVGHSMLILITGSRRREKAGHLSMSMCTLLGTRRARVDQSDGGPGRADVYRIRVQPVTLVAGPSMGHARTQSGPLMLHDNGQFWATLRPVLSCGRLIAALRVHQCSHAVP